MIVTNAFQKLLILKFACSFMAIHFFSMAGTFNFVNNLCEFIKTLSELPVYTVLFEETTQFVKCLL